MRNANRPPAESAGGMAGAAVGLGMLTMVLFPFLIPGLAVLALFAVPLLPVLLVAIVLGGVAAVPWLAARSLRRRLAARNARRSGSPARVARA